MDRQATMAEQRTIRRAIALLVSLADVAEQAAGRSAPVRVFLLWLLHRAETIAADWFLDAAGIPAPAFDAFAASGDGGAAILRLAERLRVLAAWLAALLPDAWGTGLGPAPRCVAVGHRAPRPAGVPGGPARWPNDTS